MSIVLLVGKGGGRRRMCSKLRAQASLAKIDTRWLQIQYAKRRRTATGDGSWLRAIGVDQRLGEKSSVVLVVVMMAASLSQLCSLSAGEGGANKVRWELGRHQDCAGYD